MLRFVGVTWGMVALLALAMAFGGGFALAALLYITVIAYFLDKLTALAASDHPGAEFPSGDGLSISLGLVHFALLYAGVWAIAASALPGLDKVLIFLALSLFLGQVSNSNAHELIHRSSRGLRRLGVGVYSSMLFGHHASAHVRVHHVHAATKLDPNSARLGEHFYLYLSRAWRGEWLEGYRAESRFRKGRGLHPYLGYLAGGLVSLALAWAIAKGAGIAALLALSAYAQVQLYLSDYVQHYGLMRAETAPGKWEPVGPQHSWNSPHGFTSALMLNAPRHSDHHAHPARPYPGLDLDRDVMPILPYPLPMMAVIALLPPIWCRMMDKRAARFAPPARAC